MSADDRRRQLLGIGLSRLMETPIQDLSLDEVAIEGGISRGLLFHYFPTKTDFYLECIAAAGRRILRNTAPDEEAAGDLRLKQMVRRMVEQIDRRRAFYLSLVHGAPEIARVYESVREVSTDRVVSALRLGPDGRVVVHAWWAYVEDRALAWAAEPQDGRASTDALVEHSCDALRSLLALP